MASQGSQSLSNFPLSLPLLKYSYATVPEGTNAPIPWIHLSSKSNLVAIFDNTHVEMGNGAVEERQKFKIIRDPEIMEEIDLGALSRLAHQSLAVAQHPKSHNHSPETTIVVKVPLIAIRYPLTGGQVRRFQVRFAGNEYFYDAMKILSRANIPIQEAGSQSPSRPQTGSSTFAGHQASTSDSASQGQSRPASASSYDESHSQSVTSGLNSELISVYCPRPSTSSSGLMPPPSLYSHGGNKTERQSSQSFACIEGPPLSLQTSSIKDGTKPLECFSSEGKHVGAFGQFPSAKISQETRTTAESRNLTTGRPIHHSTSDEFQRPLTAPSITDHHVSSTLPPKRELPFKPSKPKSRPLSAGNADILRPIDSEETNTDIISSTAPELMVRNVIDEKPRLEAPKTAAKRKHESKGKKSESTATKNPRPSSSRKKSTAKKAKESTPVPSVEDMLKSAEILEQTRLSEAEKLEELGECAPQQHDINSQHLPEVAHSNILSKPADIPGSTRDLLRNSKVITNPDPWPMATSKDDSQTPTVDIPGTPTDQVLIPATQKSTVDAKPNSQPNDTDLSQINNSITSDPTSFSPPRLDLRQLLADPAFAKSTPRLKTWTALPEDQRTRMLETWMCEQYRNPEFLTLCKTIESVWQSILVYPGPSGH